MIIYSCAARDSESANDGMKMSEARNVGKEDAQHAEKNGHYSLFIVMNFR